MGESTSPDNIDVMRRESKISDEVLLLGIHGGQFFDPEKSLCLYVHLYDYLSSHGRLTLKLYDNFEIEADSKKTLDDALELCIEKSCQRTLVPLVEISASGKVRQYVRF